LIRRETLQDRVNDVQPPRAVDACTHRGVLFGTDLFEIRKDYLASLETLSRGSRSFPAVPGTQVANQHLNRHLLASLPLMGEQPARRRQGTDGDSEYANESHFEFLVYFRSSSRRRTGQLAGLRLVAPGSYDPGLACGSIASFLGS
jgi:hypothetical protein